MPLQAFFYQSGLITPKLDMSKTVALLRERKVEPVSGAEERPLSDEQARRPPALLQHRASVLSVQVACLEKK